MIRPILTLGMLLFAMNQPALAGPLDEAKAREHLKAAAAGNLEAVMKDYLDDAYMDWVGGPLDGRYRGKEAIRAVWQKFFAANSGQPRPTKFGEFEAYANPQGATVAAEAEFGGTKPVKVWHGLVYRDGSLATEIWQIAPAIKVGH